MSLEISIFSGSLKSGRARAAVFKTRNVNMSCRDNCLSVSQLGMERDMGMMSYLKRMLAIRKLG